MHSIPVSSFQLKLNCKGLVPQQMMTVSVTRWGNEDWGKKTPPLDSISTLDTSVVSEAPLERINESY